MPAENTEKNFKTQTPEVVLLNPLTAAEKSAKLRQKIEELKKKRDTNVDITKERIEELKDNIVHGFDPDLEVKKILKLPSKERKKAHKAFKELLDIQQEGLAELQESVINAIYQNPDTSAEDLMKLVISRGEKVGMNEKQKQIAKEVIDTYEKKHKSVKDFFNLKLSAKEMYAKVFGVEPKGRIEVIPGPMTLYFRCQKLNDFALIHSEQFGTDKALSLTEIEDAAKSHGVRISTSLIPELRGTIIAENSGPIGYWTGILSDFEENNLGKFKISRSTRVHEEQHALRSLFVDILIGEDGFDRLAKAITQEQKDFAIRNIMRFRRQSAEAETADEILAHLKGRTNISEIKTRMLNKTSSYRSVVQEEEYQAKYSLGTKFPNENPKLIAKISNEVFGEEYNELVTSSLMAIDKLKSVGFSTNKIIALLTHEPLGRWSKVVDRLIEQKQ